MSKKFHAKNFLNLQKLPQIFIITAEKIFEIKERFWWDWLKQRWVRLAVSWVTGERNLFTATVCHLTFLLRRKRRTVTLQFFISSHDKNFASCSPSSVPAIKKIFTKSPAFISNFSTCKNNFLQKNNAVALKKFINQANKTFKNF